VLALKLANFNDRQLSALKPWFSKAKELSARVPVSAPYLRVLLVLACYGFVAWAPLSGRFAQQFVIFFVYGAVLSALLLRAAASTVTMPALGPVRWGLSRYTAPVVVLFWLNGCSPYLGYKTEGSIAMYSNLYTEGETNHFLIPTSLQMFDFQIPVVVERTNIDGLRQAARTRRPVTTYELWREVQREPQGRVVFRQGGQSRTHDGARGDQPDYSPSWLVRKTARFKRITTRRPHPCTH
jgi:hypothetical protein